MYKALSYFTDTQDNDYEYKAGDIYPRNGYKPSKERIEVLSTGANVRGVPVIVEIVNNSPDKAVKTEKGTIAPEDCINPPTEAEDDEKEVKPKRKGKTKNA